MQRILITACTCSQFKPFAIHQIKVTPYTQYLFYSDPDTYEQSYDSRQLSVIVVISPSMMVLCLSFRM